MIYGNISKLPKIGEKLIYIDELEEEPVSRKVVFIEIVKVNKYNDPETAFVYLSSEEPSLNIENIGTIRYCQIVVYDNLGPIVNGFHRNYIEANNL